jgi:hypothetical protein
VVCATVRKLARQEAKHCLSLVGAQMMAFVGLVCLQFNVLATMLLRDGPWMRSCARLFTLPLHVVAASFQQKGTTYTPSEYKTQRSLPTAAGLAARRQVGDRPQAPPQVSANDNLSPRDTHTHTHTRTRTHTHTHTHTHCANTRLSTTSHSHRSDDVRCKQPPSVRSQPEPFTSPWLTHTATNHRRLWSSWT